MSVPVIPIKNEPQALNDLLESIALEETALAHVINAEGEKIQTIQCKFAEGTLNAEETEDLQDTVQEILQTAIKMQMLLQFKLEDVLEAIRQLSSSESCFPGSDSCFECGDSSGHSCDHDSKHGKE